MTNPKHETAQYKSSSDSYATTPEQGRVVGPVTIGASTGAAAGVVLTWLLSLAGVEVPPAVQNAVAVLLPPLLALLGGWLVKPGTGKRRE